MDISAIDLFCGVGGLTHGLQQSGIKVIAGYDTDLKCKYPYETNNNSKFINLSVSDIKVSQLINKLSESKIKLLAGCAPCQPFSNYTQALTHDARWGLLGEFSRIAKELKPDIITMENVPELHKHPIFEDFIQTLKKLKYNVSYSIVFCPDYGIPQNRKRLVLLASKLAPITLIRPSHKPNSYVTLKNAIGSLPPLRAGKTNSQDILHRAAGLSEINLKRIKASKQGGSWKDWPDELLSNCHKKESGKKYTSVYGRMQWNKLSPTITTQFYNYGSGRHGHPSQARAISLREAAILQTFPSDYSFTNEEKYSITDVSRMIGNAVPVQLGKIIGQSILKHVEYNY